MTVFEVLTRTDAVAKVAECMPFIQHQQTLQQPAVHTVSLQAPPVGRKQTCKQTCTANTAPHSSTGVLNARIPPFSPVAPLSGAVKHAGQIIIFEATTAGCKPRKRTRKHHCRCEQERPSFMLSLG